MTGICMSCDYNYGYNTCVNCNKNVCFSCIIDKFTECDDIEINENGTCDLCYDIWKEKQINNGKTIEDIEIFENNQSHKYMQYALENGIFVKCDNCGYIWDGNAQCNCWMDYEYESIDINSLELNDYTDNEYTDNESDFSEESFNPLMYGFEPTSVTDIRLFD